MQTPYEKGHKRPPNDLSEWPIDIRRPGPTSGFKKTLGRAPTRITHDASADFSKRRLAGILDTESWHRRHKSVIR